MGSFGKATLGETDVFGSNAFAPQEIAERVQGVGVKKARLPLLSQLILSVLGGAFIGMGALCYVLIHSDPGLGFAARQAGAALSFCLGMLLVVVAGAELFTGNNLIVMARAQGSIGSGEVVRNWLIVFAGNLVGTVGLALLVVLSRHPDMNGGAIGRDYLQIAAAKAALPFMPALWRGVLCNALVCLAIWMSYAGRSVIDKAVAIVFPIAAFVAAGFEHSIANLYYFAMALLLAPESAMPLLGGMLRNIVAVVIGNVIGGSVLVGLVYYLIYIRPPGRLK
ncbi:formate transporter [Massilia sp. WF1]|uniref:formate/nitrite transporter family protein n=1 Tax=unclassified Massilia TaxID=2609279 RepID=UPI000649DE9E|nr:MULTISPECIES: formate/nitrite transporter family protein [unclassified Massilia]ALK96355.1 formate transporter FocA [Massilia sp. WG5]KLU37661.1 formate transporter [Massilia sp. WF1]